MHIGSRAARKAFEKVRHEFGLKIAHQPRAYFGVDGKGRAPAQIDGRNRQRLIHRHYEVAGAQNAALVAQRAIKRLAQRDTDVFNRVVLIDIQIAFTGEVQVKCAVPREQFQHVIEESNAG